MDEEAENVKDVQSELEKHLMDEQDEPLANPVHAPAGRFLGVDLGTRTIATGGEFSVVERDGKKFLEQKVTCFFIYFS